MKTTINNKEYDVEKGTKVIDVIDNSERRYLGCRIDNNDKPLDAVIPENSVIELVDLHSHSGIQMYQASLRYVVLMACNKILPKKRIIFNYSVSRSIFTSIVGLGHPLNHETFVQIRDEVDRIIRADLPIRFNRKSREEVIKFYESVGYNDKIQLLKYEHRKELSLYECDGYLNFLYSPLVPSTGFLTKYALKMYAPGLLIQYPRLECGCEIPPFEEEKSFRAALKEANRWNNTIKIDSIAQINNIIEQGKALELINLCETRHNAQLTHLGDKIEDNIDNIKVICVAGPSSSGKTTFTNRLRIELTSRGIEPLMISMDNFYKGSDYPLDEDGKPDYEHINSLNLDLFDEVIVKLVSGEETSLPIFNFANKETTFTEPVKLKKNQPILIEGIHALNPEIMPSVPDENKYRVYIAPLGQMRYDTHTPISISDLRLMRRMVRDHRSRATSVERTIETWDSVRKGEFRWIYPNQNNADFVYNSELTYEIPVMRKYLIPLLNNISKESHVYYVAKRMLKFLNFFEDISDKWIPSNSILREFIGDSIFYTNDVK